MIPGPQSQVESDNRIDRFQFSKQTPDHTNANFSRHSAAQNYGGVPFAVSSEALTFQQNSSSMQNVASIPPPFSVTHAVPQRLPIAQPYTYPRLSVSQPTPIVSTAVSALKRVQNTKPSTMHDHMSSAIAKDPPPLTHELLSPVTPHSIGSTAVMSSRQSEQSHVERPNTHPHEHAVHNAQVASQLKHDGRPHDFSIGPALGARMIPTTSAATQLPTNLKWDDHAGRRWSSNHSSQNTITHVPFTASSSMLHRSSARHVPASYADPTSRTFACESGGLADSPNNNPFAQHWVNDGKHEPVHMASSAHQGYSTAHTNEDNGVNLLGGTDVMGVQSLGVPTMNVSGHGSRLTSVGGLPSDIALHRLPPHNRSPRARARPTSLSDTERRERHNAHTRSSRLRIDQGIRKLADALKKARPGLKLNKKADIVVEAVKYVLETCQAMPSIPRSSIDQHDPTLPS